MAGRFDGASKCDHNPSCCEFTPGITGWHRSLRQSLRKAMDYGCPMKNSLEIADRPSSYRWVVMVVWLVCSQSGMMVIFTLGILLPSITTELDLSPSQQGTLGSAAFWGSLALGIPLSWWTSRYSPKLLTTVTLVMAGLLLCLQGWAPSFGILLAGRLGFGLATVAREPARVLLLRQWFHQREIILVNAISNAFFGLVVGGGWLLTPFILSIAGDNWRSVLYTYAGAIGVLTIIWVTLGRERAIQEPRSQGSTREAAIFRGALVHRDLWVAGFGFLGVTLANSAFLTFFPTLMLNDYDISLKWSGRVLALTILVGGVVGLVVGYLVGSAAYRRKAVLGTFGVLMVGTYVGMALSGSILILAPLALVNGVTFGFWPILQTVPFQLRGIRPREIAVASAFIMSAISSGTILGPLVTGFLQEALGDLRSALLVVCLTPLSLTAAGIFLRLGAEEATVQIGDVAYRSKH